MNYCPFSTSHLTTQTIVGTYLKVSIFSWFSSFIFAHACAWCIFKKNFSFINYCFCLFVYGQEVLPYVVFLLIYLRYQLKNMSKWFKAYVGNVNLVYYKIKFRLILYHQYWYLQVYSYGRFRPSKKLVIFQLIICKSCYCYYRTWLKLLNTFQTSYTHSWYTNYL